MSLIDTEVIDILITAHDEAQAAFAEASAEADATSGHFSMMAHGIGLGMVAAGAAAAGVLALSAKAAIDFQSMTTKVMNNTTMGAAGMATMRTAILTMSAASGAPLDQLANGFMHIQNLGYLTADSITILQQAMESAVSTGSNTGDVANALALQMHDFGLNATQAARAMDVMHLAAAEGNATLEQYVDSTSKAVSTAANLGLSMTDTDAALSALSRHMNISQASTMLAGMLQKISGPSVSAQKELAALSKTSGIDLVADFSAAGLKARGLTGVLADLEAATHGNYTEIQKLIPATRGGMAALVLNGTASKDYQTILASLNATMAGQSTPTIQAYAAYLSTAAGTQARLTAGLNVMAIEIGTAVLPALQSMLSATLPLVQSLTTWVGKHAQLTAHILEGVAAVGLLTATIMVFTPVVSAVGAVLGAVSLPLVAIVAAGAILYEAWQHDWGGIQEKTQVVWTTVKPVFDAMGKALVSLRAAFTAGGLGAVFSDLPGAAGGVGTALGGVGSAIAAQFGSINWPNVEATVVHGFNDVFNTMASWLQQTGLPFIGGRLADLKDAFSHIDWSAIGSAILAGLGRIKDAIAGIDWKGVGSAILGALGKLKDDVAALDWGGLWGTLKSAFTGIVSWIRSLDWGGWAQDAISGLRAGADTVGGWIRDAGNSTFVKNLETWVGAFAAWVPGATVAFLKAWPGMLSSVMDKIGSAAGPILLQLGTWAVQFVKWIAPAIPKMVEALVGFTVALATFILETVVTIGVGLVKWGVKFAEWVAPYVPGMLSALGTLAGSLISWIGDEAPILGSHLTAWGARFSAWVPPATSGMLSALGTLLGNTGTWIGSAAATLTADIRRWVPAFVSWVMHDAWPAMAGALDQLGQALGRWIVLTSPPSIALHLTVWAVEFAKWVMSLGWSGLLKALESLLSAFTGWITGGAASAIGKAMLAWPAAMLAVFNGAAVLLVTSGYHIVTGLINGMIAQTSALLGEIDHLIGTSIRAPFDSAATWLRDAGQHIIDGLISGIKSKIGDLTGLLGHITSLIPLHKGPPGADILLLQENGQLIMQGLINGLKSQEGPLGAFLSGVTNSIKLGAGLTSTPGPALLGAGVASGGSQTNNITVHIHGTSATVNGDQNGLGKYVGDVLVQAFRQLDRAAGSSNTVAGRLSLGGAL